jgi:magnesium transporter
MSESKFYHFSETGKLHNYGSPDEAMEHLKNGGFIWFDYYDPAKEDLAVLIEKIGLHPLSIEDCLDEKQIPKIEYFQNNTFIIFNSFSYIARELFIDEIDIFLGKSFLITVSGHNSGTRRPLNDLAGLIESGKTKAHAGPDFLMHFILDYIVDEKYRPFDEMEDELMEAEESIIDNVESFKPVLLIQLRKKLMTLRKSLFHEREILIKISRQDELYINKRAIAHYRDVYDHVTKFFELTETYREIETSLMELYSSLLNNQITKMANKTNISVRRLTMIATIFMPLTLIAGIGGMSEYTMMTGATNWKVSYLLFLLGMIIIAVINYIFIRRLDKK